MAWTQPPPVLTSSSRRRSWELPALAVAPRQVRDRVREFATHVGFPADRLEEVLICVSDAVTNAVMHAYRGRDEAGRVEIEARAEDRDLVICVRDDGTGLAPRSDSPGMGLGLPIIAALANSVDLRDGPDGGAEIVMRFSPN